MKDYTTKYMYQIKQNNRPNDVLQYNISRQSEENDDCVDQKEFKSIDQFNNYNMHIRQFPVDCQHKVSITVKIFILLICVLNYYIFIL